MKECRTCKVIKELTDFTPKKTNKDGLEYTCKSCRCEKAKIYYKEHCDKIKPKRTQFYHLNKNRINKERKEYLKNYQKRPKVKTIRNLRNRLYYALKNKMWKKNCSFDKYIGLDNYNELVIYLESKFTEGMTWDNYGKWHIDHIIPLSSAQTDDELYKLCHYTNLQPLWGIDNWAKGIKKGPHCTTLSKDL